VNDEVRKPILASALCMLALAPLAIAAYTIGPTAHVDGSLLLRLARLDEGAGQTLADGFAHLGDWPSIVAMVMILVGVAYALGRRRQALAALVLVAGANVTTEVLKHLLAHSRFEVDFAGFHQPWADAFPSGHTTGAASVAAALVLVVPPRARPIAAACGAAFAGLVGVSMVIIQAHYPSDVLGGVLVVASWSFAVIAGLRLTRPRGPASPPREETRPASGRFAISLE
jgi:membrane-associated phospholipid phosphatase